jgi:CubicO group peptidase (beta-lactamase class C family)
MAYYKVKGLSIAVVDNYKVVWAKGYGWADEKEKRPMTTETLFKPGSISKSLNAVGVLRLAQDKKLDLNTDINAYLTSWKFPYDSLSKGKKITLSHLLSHMGGLSVYGGFPGYDIKGKIPTVPEILEGKGPANTPPVRSLFEPGLQFQYSGGGVIISQLIITDVTHQSYEKFMYDSVLKPMGMTHSFYSAQPPAGNKLNSIATGYTKDGAEAEATWRVYPEQAPQGLWTTPTELCNYIVELQLAKEGKSSKVLNQQMAQMQLTPTVDAVAALGLFIDTRGETKYFQHDALNPGFCGVFYGSIESGKGVAICLNSDDARIMKEVLNSVATVYKWKDFYNPVFKNEISVPENIFEKYMGIYRYDNNLASVFKKQDGYYFWTAGIDTKMHFTSEKEFFNQEFQSEKTFVSDASGNVTGYLRKIGDKTYPASVKIENADTITVSIDEIMGISRHLLETKQYDKAINFLNRGLVLEPGNLPVTLNLAHTYLFKNEYEKAIKLYKENLNKEVSPGSPVKDFLKEDFVYFKKTGFDKSLMDKVLADLKLEQPDGYKVK